MRRPVSIFLFVSALGLALPDIARAQPAPPVPSQPSAADLESARDLYKAGKELRQRGDLRGALEKFKQAHAYGQTPVTALELGRTHMQVGELLEAREVLLSVARMKVQSDETEKSAAARTEAADLAEQIRPRIPSLSIRVSGAGVAQDAPVQLTVDGAPVPIVSLTALRKANPGAHSIVARLGTREAKADADVAEGETRDVALLLPPETAPVGNGGGAPNPGGEPGDRGGGSIHPLTWIGLGVGIAGIGLGTVTGLMALGKAQDVHSVCTGLSCPTSAQNDVDKGRMLATISTIGFIAGGAGLAVGAVGLFVLSPSGPRASSAPQVRAVAKGTWGGTWVGLDGSF